MASSSGDTSRGERLEGPGPASHTATATATATSIATVSFPSSWIYARFITEYPKEVLCALNMQSTNPLAVPPWTRSRRLCHGCPGQTSLCYWGGTSDGSASHDVFVGDVVWNKNTIQWSKIEPMLFPRRAAAAVAANGRVFVFGGRPKEDHGCHQWAEVYDPSTSSWKHIPSSPTLKAAYNNLCSKGLTVVVTKNQMFIRNTVGGISLDAKNWIWSRLPDNLIDHWHPQCYAAAMEGMLVTWHYNATDSKLRIQAYDVQQDKWLPLAMRGADNLLDFLHKQENRGECHFMSVDGKLVIYHTLTPNASTFSFIDIKEKRDDSLLVKHSMSYVLPRIGGDIQTPAHAANSGGRIGI